MGHGSYLLRVEVKPLDARVHHLRAHLPGQLHAVRLHRLVVLADGLQVLPHLVGHGGAAEGRHALEGGVALDRHHPWYDWACDVSRSTSREVFDKHLGVIKELRQHKVSPGRNFILLQSLIK
jgi:hypothetical protein